MDDYESCDGLALAERVRRREVSAAELLEAAISRTERLNQSLNAVVTPIYDAARLAISQGLPQGVFSGVPYLLKELVVSAAGTASTSGSRLLSANMAQVDSEIVSRMRRAGLVIFGKTNSPEFGLSPTTESLLYGVTRNPWQLGLAPGGSSGGSAAAVAAGIVPMAHATDGGGSIRIPASCCALFGLKPTRGRITAGPEGGEGLNGLAVQHALTRSVRDSAALLDATAGPMPGDPYRAPPPRGLYLDEVTTDPGRLRIAFSRQAPNATPVHPDCVNAVEHAALLCEQLGHLVEEAMPEFDANALERGFVQVFSANTMANIARVTGGPLPAPDLVEPLTYALAQRGRQIDAAQYILTLHGLHRQSRAIAKFFERYDIWLTPTLATPPTAIGHFDIRSSDVDRWIAQLMAYIPFTYPFNITGQPAMSVPLWWNNQDVPIGCQFAAAYGEEATLFRLAGQLERAQPWFMHKPGSGVASQSA